MKSSPSILALLLLVSSCSTYEVANLNRLPSNEGACNDIVQQLISPLEAKLITREKFNESADVVYKGKDRSMIWDFQQSDNKFFVGNSEDIYTLEEGVLKSVMNNDDATFGVTNFTVNGDTLYAIRTSVNGAQDAQTTSYLWVIDLKTKTKLKSIRLKKPVQLAGGHNSSAFHEGKLYVSSSSGFAVVDLATGNQTAVKAPRQANFARFKIHDGSAYVVSRGTKNKVFKINLENLEVNEFATLNKEEMPFDIEFVQNKILVANFQGIQVLDDSGKSLVELPIKTVWNMKYNQVEGKLYASITESEKGVGYSKGSDLVKIDVAKLLEGI